VAAAASEHVADALERAWTTVADRAAASCREVGLQFIAGLAGRGTAAATGSTRVDGVPAPPFNGVW